LHHQFEIGAQVAFVIQGAKQRQGHDTNSATNNKAIGLGNEKTGGIVECQSFGQHHAQQPGNDHQDADAAGHGCAVAAAFVGDIHDRTIQQLPDDPGGNTQVGNDGPDEGEDRGFKHFG